MKITTPSTIALLVGALTLSAQAASKPASISKENGSIVADSTIMPAQEAAGDTFIAYYFHGTVRCATCRKLENYSQEALETGFADKLADSSLIWQVVNYDEKENKHYIKDYRLFTKAVILSRVRDGKEVNWTNLAKIWELVNDKEEFIAYVQAEAGAFFEGDVVDVNEDVKDGTEEGDEEDEQSGE